jgi:transposase-like protein
MAARCQHGSKVTASRQAAELYLAGELTVGAACERFGIARGSVWSAVDRLRKERGIQGPRSGT